MSVQRKIIDCIARDKKIFVGLEDSKTTWKICVRMDKQIIHETSMPSKYKVLRSFFDKNFPSCDIHVVYEAGFAGFGLCKRLLEDGYDCIIVPPHTVMQEKCSRVKNDHTDARLLAKNLEDGNCKSCHVPDDELLADRQLERDHRTTKKDVRREQGRIRSLIFYHGIETGIVAASWTKNHYKALRYINVDSPNLRRSLHHHLDRLEFLLAQEADLWKELRLIATKERYVRAMKIAQSFPGIGELTAIRLVLELGEDLSRFRSGGEIASFVGLGGTEYSSGETERRGHITKQGSGPIRSWLVESALVGRKKDPALMQFYLRIKQNTGNHKKAIVAVARKLIIRLRSCMIRNIEYEFGVIQ